MTHVRKGESIRAATINEMMDGIISLAPTYKDAKKLRPIMPETYIVQGNSKTEIKNDQPVYTLTSISLYNAYYESDGTAFNTGDKKWTENLDSISSIWLCTKTNQTLGTTIGISVVNNLELAQIKSGLSTGETVSTQPIYEISANTANNYFEITKDYRYIIRTSGGGGGGGGGGGSECDCQLTAYYQESEDNNHLATWTKAGNTVEVWAPKKGEIVLSGNDGTYTDSASGFKFASANDSNVKFTCNGTTITVGVYYV